MTMMQAYKQLYAEGGYKRFFKAGATNVFRNYIVCGVTLPVYDLCVNTLNHRFYWGDLIKNYVDLNINKPDFYD